MYVPPLYKLDRAACLAFAAARGFGTVIGYDGAHPVASPLPFVIAYADDGTPRVQLHVARGNPLAALAARGGEWLVAVNGADAYVSPLWYVSPDQVPTWLYETVHLSGPVAVVPAEHSRAHLDALTARFEAGLEQAWSSERVTPARLVQLMHAIVVIEMLVEEIEGKFKLNQNKTDADHVAVVASLSRQHDPAARTVAARMVALRPHLMYQNPAGAPQAALADSGDM